MKLLFDENLSRKLVSRLADLFPGSAQVVELGLAHHQDAQIFDYAKHAGFVIVTTDADFFELVTSFGPPPKVVWLRAGGTRHGTRSRCSGVTQCGSRNLS